MKTSKIIMFTSSLSVVHRKLMKLLVLFFFCLFTTSFLSIVKNRTGQKETANNVLQKTYDKLSKMQNIKYNIYRELNYKSENYRAVDSCTKFLDFQNKDAIIGFAFQLDYGKSLDIYNGKENFILDRKKKTMKLVNMPVFADFANLSAFFNSILSLKNAIPSIIKDQEIEKTSGDTIIQEVKYYLITLKVSNKVLSSFGKFEPIQIKRDFYYKIFINQTSYLPEKIIQTNNALPNDFVLTDFKNISYNIPGLPELTWYYSTYINEFKIIKEKEINTIKVKTKAPDFNLSFADKEESVLLSTLRGNIVLLEFWIKNCGYCISAVPELNFLITKFGNRKFKLIGINAEDNKKDIALFYKRNGPTFKTLIGNEKINEAYGIYSFPTVVLLNKKGIVLYAGNLDMEKLQAIIENNLK